MTIGAAMWNGECMQSWCIDSAMIYLLRLNDTPSTVHKSDWPMKFLAQKGHGAAFCVCSHTADLSIDVARRRSVSAPTSCSSSCTAPTTCIYRRKNTTVFFWRFLLRVAFRVMRICGYADMRIRVCNLSLANLADSITRRCRHDESMLAPAHTIHSILHSLTWISFSAVGFFSALFIFSSWLSTSPRQA